MSENPKIAPQSELPFVQLFTDGACRGNPGPGGWAYILRHPSTGTQQEASDGLPETTNNRMELQAVISGLEALKKPSKVEVITDSEYVAKGCREWLPDWKANNWRRGDGKRFKPLKNEQYWRRLDELLSQHDVSFTIVRGHSGHPENELCDELSVAAAMKFLGA